MKKLLVIEDNPEVRDNLEERLSLSGYEVHSAENGKVGIELAHKVKPDLIVCDVMMPEMDGFGVLHILSKQAQTASIPFIFLTAKADATDIRQGMNLGADDYLTKPFSDLDLLKTIETRLRKSEQVKSTFDGTAEGLKSFINEARGREELEKLSRDYRTRKFDRKEFIYREGDHARSLFFIASGSVKTFRTNELGKELITHIYQPGDFIGHQALITGDPYHESAMALEASELSLVPKEDFRSLIYNNRDFSAQFIKMLTNNIEESEEQLLSLAYNSIRKRVAEALVKLHDLSASRGSTDIQILRDDLAGMVGTATESVIRTLSDFKTEKLIAVEGKIIRVLDRERLDQLAN